MSKFLYWTAFGYFCSLQFISVYAGEPVTAGVVSIGLGIISMGLACQDRQP